jgi:hypothetical protein
MYRLAYRVIANVLSGVVFLFASMFVVAHAQDLEPRSYSNTPVGLNFLIAGYGYCRYCIAMRHKQSLQFPIQNSHVDITPRL